MFAGNVEIFLFLALIVIASMAAKFKMRNGTGLLIIAVFCLFFSQLVGGIYLLVITIGGVIAFLSIKKIMSR